MGEVGSCSLCEKQELGGLQSIYGRLAASWAMKYTLPKNRVTIWLALQDRLKTKERLHRYGVTIDETCALCGHDTESSAHLFFNCHFSKECSSMVLPWLGFNTSRNNLFTLLKWIHRYCKKSFTRKVTYAAVACTVYQIWKARNLAIWEQFVPSIACIVKTIQYTVKHRVMSILSQKVRARDREWLLAFLSFEGVLPRRFASPLSELFVGV
ncbi:uncharacterized protein [Spinacia oleracea]|uniref:Reverse transcriptase zinc-binding domain-containing protein n=1 Tax=Spinacia oleracea TaxID=3562 RepID=A0A9R0IA84_SPIOL|nr:uncharacterized protein LOC110785260 [Spinacia oleracea]